jgi:hypothetical protein
VWDWVCRLKFILVYCYHNSFAFTSASHRPVVVKLAITQRPNSELCFVYVSCLSCCQLSFCGNQLVVKLSTPSLPRSTSLCS